MTTLFVSMASIFCSFLFIEHILLSYGLLCENKFFKKKYIGLAHVTLTDLLLFILLVKYFASFGFTLLILEMTWALM